jgi:hypothetical protein
MKLPPPREPVDRRRLYVLQPSAPG